MKGFDLRGSAVREWDDCRRPNGPFNGEGETLFRSHGCSRGQTEMGNSSGDLCSRADIAVAKDQGKDFCFDLDAFFSSVYITIWVSMNTLL